MPTKKADKLARYYEIKGHGDPPEPQLLEQQIPTLLPLPGSELDPNMSEENGNASGQNDGYDAANRDLLELQLLEQQIPPLPPLHGMNLILI